MIEAIEMLLRHWGEGVRCGVPSGGLGSPAGTLMEWKGGAPRTGGGGSSVLLAGAGPDLITSEVDAALSVIAQQDGGALLQALAYRRYTFEPVLSKADQVRDLHLGQGEAGLKAYTRLVHRLHELVEVQLKARSYVSASRQREAKRAGDRMRGQSLRQAKAAHVARGRELKAVGVADRSSADSVPVGSVAPRQAPAKNNR